MYCHKTTGCDPKITTCRESMEMDARFDYTVTEARRWRANAN